MTAIFFLTILWAILTAVEEFYMLNVRYWHIFCDVISLLAQVFIVPFEKAYKRVVCKKNFYGSVFDIRLYLRKAKYRPCDLNLWPMKVNVFQWIDNDPVSVLYEFQIDISTNSWEIKYQNMGIGLLHVKRRTRQKWRSMTSDRHQIWHTDREYGVGRGCMTAIFFRFLLTILWVLVILV